MSTRIKNPLDFEKLRAGRLALDVTQAAAGRAAFGDKCKCPAQTWNAYEKGRIKNPSEDIVKQLAAALGIEDHRDLITVAVAPTPAPGPIVAVSETDVEDAYKLGHSDGYTAGYAAGQKDASTPPEDLVSPPEDMTAWTPQQPGPLVKIPGRPIVPGGAS